MPAVAHGKDGDERPGLVVLVQEVLGDIVWTDAVTDEA